MLSILRLDAMFSDGRSPEEDFLNTFPRGLPGHRAPTAPGDGARGEPRVLKVDEAGSETVCLCRRVTRGDIERRVAEGLEAGAILEATGAGSVCGGCSVLVEALARGTPSRAASLVGTARLDPRHDLYVFEVDGGGAVGHGDVVVEAEVGGRRLSRTYTVTDHDPESGRVEIVVRHEPHGVVSRWLRDHATGDSVFRITPHSDGGVDEGPVYFVAAGVGVTPALAGLREMARTGRGRMLLHWSARFEEGSALTGMVVAAARAAEGSVAFLHDTARHGRMDMARLARLAPFDGTGTVRACGPAGFMEDVVSAFVAAGWPPERVLTESFVRAGTAPFRQSRTDFDAWNDPVVAEGLSLRPVGSVADEAVAFLRQFSHEHGARVPLEARTEEVLRSVAASGTYAQTYDELAYGARLAWRNSTRCVGRFFWQMLTVFDRRDVRDAEGVFAAVLEHVEWATNGGDLRPAISVFDPNGPRVRILNPQLILYAGYERADGSVVGDPKNVAFTDYVRTLGWRGRGGRFDVLPLVVRIGDAAPRVFEFPPGAVLEVPLSHREHAGFADLGLRWFALPAVADMALDVGGIQYGAAPSSGVYMGTEIGSLNLGDPGRYDVIADVARAIGLDTGEDEPLWRDRAILEANRAVLHSFRGAGVRIFDHHALSEYFVRFSDQERGADRPVYAHWPWIVPPMSSNLSPMWHDKGMRKVVLKPNYFYQPREYA